MVAFFHEGNAFGADGQLNDEFILWAAKLFRRWRQEVWQDGGALTLGAMREEIERRWPYVTRYPEMSRIIAAADELDHTAPLPVPRQNARGASRARGR